MVHLGCMKLYAPWNFICIRIGWHCICLWGTDQALTPPPITVRYVAGCISIPRRSWWPPPILTVWLTHLHVFCNVFRGWFCSWWLPHILLFSWRGVFCEYLQVWKSLIDIFISPSLEYLNYLCYFCVAKFGEIELFRDDFTMLCVLELFGIFVFRLGSKLPCLFSFLFYFLMDPVPFRFSRSSCHLFSCFFLSIPIRWHLNLLARALVLNVCFLSI